MDCFNKFFIEGEEVRFFEVHMWQEDELDPSELSQWITLAMLEHTSPPGWIFGQLIEGMALEFERDVYVPDWRKVYWECRPMMKEATPLSPG
jgi:hypothetical protein